MEARSQSGLVLEREQLKGHPASDRAIFKEEVRHFEETSFGFDDS
jgi:hypothetical protein